MDTLTIVIIVAVALLAYLLGKLAAELRFKRREQDIRKDAAARSRAVIGGQFSEQLAPYLPDFPYKPTEVKFLGKPTDFVVFEGLDDKDIRRVVFVEVKTGKSTLSQTERSLRDAVEAAQVAFEEYRVPDKVTRGKE